MIRSPSALRAAREAFEDGKSAFVDENGELVAAGKPLPSDEPSSHEFLKWHSNTTPPEKVSALGDISNGTRRQAVQALSGSSVGALLREEPLEIQEPTQNEAQAEAPFASGGDWDVEPRKEDSPQEEEEQLQVVVEAPSAAIEEIVEAPATEEIVEAAPKPRRLRRKKQTERPAPPIRRRWLVINQPVTKQQKPVLGHDAKKQIKKPREPLTVTRHFPRSPVLYNKRFPPSSATFETEYSDEFAWPQTPIRLR